MESLALILTFALGAAIGSFLNVVILRYNSGHTLGGRSMCLSCGKRLGSAELVPILSFLALRGRCGGCSTPISMQYPLVELATAVIFAGVYSMFAASGAVAVQSVLELLLLWAIWGVLIVIVGYDIRHKIIPDLFAGLFILLSLALDALLYGSALLAMPHLLLTLLAGPILAAPFALLWLISGGKWIGFGDAKLALGIGWLLGLAPGLSAILIGFWSGALLSVLLLLVSKLPEGNFLRHSKLIPRRITGKTEIPFAPFLILGTALVFFFNLIVIAF